MHTLLPRRHAAVYAVILGYPNCDSTIWFIWRCGQHMKCIPMCEDWAVRGMVWPSLRDASGAAPAPSVLAEEVPARLVCTYVCICMYVCVCMWSVPWTHKSTVGLR